MAYRTWTYDVLSSLAASRLAKRLPVYIHFACVRGALKLGYAPPPRPRAHAEATAAFVKYLQLDEESASRTARSYSDAFYLSGLHTWYLVNSDERAISTYLDERVTLVGSENLLTATVQGPVIAFTGHFGLPVAGVLALSAVLRERCRVNTFFAPPDENPATAGFRETFERSRLNIRPLPVGPRGTIQALRALRDGELLTMQPDVFDNRTGSAAVVPFLNGLTFAMTGTAYLAIRSGATLLPVHTTLEPGGRLVVNIGKPISYVQTGDSEEHLIRLTELLFAELERAVRARPEQWVYWQTLSERMVPGVTIAPAARHTIAAWKQAYEQYRTIAASIIPCLAEPRFAPFSEN